MADCQFRANACGLNDSDGAVQFPVAAARAGVGVEEDGDFLHALKSLHFSLSHAHSHIVRIGFRGFVGMLWNQFAVIIPKRWSILSSAS